MASFNRVILMGNLTRDPVVRPLGSGSVVEFGLAMNKKFKDSSGEQREDTCFVDCEIYNDKIGKIFAEYKKSGDCVQVEGELSYRTWEDKNGGGKRNKLSVRVNNFVFVDSGGGANKSESQPQQKDRQQQRYSQNDRPPRQIRKQNDEEVDQVFR